MKKVGGGIRIDIETLKRRKHKINNGRYNAYDGGVKGCLVGVLVIGHVGCRELSESGESRTGSSWLSEISPRDSALAFCREYFHM